MGDVNIFIASSFDTQFWREAIGNSIREWNDFYEPKGYRLRMKCWEDFYPEFNGIRKQDEYNEELVKQSHIMFALFENNCGEYTQEEISFGLKYYPEHVHIIRHNKSVNKELDVFLDKINLRAEECETTSNMLKFVKNTIDSYISTLSFCGTPSPTQTYNIYATIPDDRKEERIPLGNMIRFLDDVAESKFNLRCKLNHNHFDEIQKSHYFLSILKDNLSNNDLNELCVALSNTSCNGNPLSSIIYINDFISDKNKEKDSAIDNNPALSSLINGKGIFKEAFDSRHRVKFNLLMWLLDKSIILVDKNSALTIKDDWISFYGIKILKSADLNIEGDTLEEKIVNLIAYINKRFIFRTAIPNDENELSDEVIQTIISECKSSQKIRNSLLETEIEKFTKVKDILNSKLKKLLDSNDLSKEDQRLVENYYIEKIEVEKELSNLDVSYPKEILRSQFGLLKFAEEYSNTFDFNYLNHLYKQISETADEYQIISPQVEMYRMNYANSLIKNNENRKAVELYQLSMDRFNDFDDRAELIQKYIVHLFINGINFLTDLGFNAEAKSRIEELENKINRWSDYDDEKLNLYFYRVMILAAKLRIRPLLYDTLKLIINGTEILTNIKEKNLRPTDTSIEDDIFCDFRICLAAAMIDFYKRNFNSLKQNADKIESILKDAELWLNENKDISDYYKLLEKGEIYHNLSFLFANLENVELERKYANSCIDFRRKLYSITKDASIKESIADILINLGASYVNDPYNILSNDEKNTALGYATESLVIYNELNTENYINQVTDIHKALLLKGTILFRSSEKEERDNGLKLILKCFQWSHANPENYYYNTFTSEFVKAFFAIK